ncbi:hypothetical protein MYX07_03040 [Patescibacteria group bacterium AH-259-L07]|nr:hypothetical protein [Patescibacteria group bacterium AH-259-L07]
MAHAAKYIPVPIRADISHLSERDKKVLQLLIQAVKLMNPIFLSQANQDEDKVKDRQTYDKTRGNNFYPQDLTREEFEAYLKGHPEDKEALLNPFTNVVRQENKLRAVPYSEVYEKELSQAAQLLEQVVELTPYPQFQKFLLGRAQAFRTNEYKQNDVEWIQANDSPFELILGPSMCYDDTFLGIKRSFDGMLGIVAKKETQRAGQYKEWTAKFDAWLGKRYGYEAKGMLVSMIIMDEIIASGDAFYNYVYSAWNSRVDDDIHKTVDSKKVLIRNAIDAKLNCLTIPIAKCIVSPQELSLFDSSNYFLFIIGHELSHGLSFHFGGKNFFDLGAPFEEAKADVFGLYFFQFLADQGEIAQGIAANAVIVRVIDGLRQVRLSLEGPHAVGTLVQYNWLLKHGAFRFSGQGFEFNPDCFRSAISTLGDEFYKLSQVDDYEIVKQFVDKWGGVPDEIRRMCESLEGMPVDIDPVFDY